MRRKFYLIVLVPRLIGLLFSLMLFSLLPTWASAAVVNSLYQASIPVQNQSVSQREQAVSQALGQVLVKVSGNASIVSVPQIKAALKRADGFMQQYSYQQIPATQDNTSQADDFQNVTPAPTLELQVHFDTRAVNRLLTNAGQAIWSDNRPTILVWLALATPHGYSLIGNDADDGIPQLVRKDAAERGLPILFPLLDLQDQQKITFNDVWNLNANVAYTASQRYVTNAVLLGKIDQDVNATQLQAQWLFMLGDQTMSWQTQGDSLAKVIDPVMTNIADTLAQRYAVLATPSTQPQQQLLLTVNNVTKTSDFAKVLKYLRGLSLVSKVQVLQVGPSQVELGIDSEGGEQALVQAIGLDHVLQAISNDPSSNTLQYRLVL